MFHQVECALILLHYFIVHLDYFSIFVLQIIQYTSFSYII